MQPESFLSANIITMKHFFSILTIVFFSFTGISHAQEPKTGKVRALRMSYLSGKLNLSEQQATKFWPVYNRYSDERKALRDNYKANFKGGQSQMDKIEANKFVDDNIEYQEKELALKKKYKDELLKIITPQQLANLYQSEREFKKILIEQLRNEGK